MAEILLSSENNIKSVTSISDNVSGKYILTSLREAQEVGLKSILGDALLKRLKDMVKDAEVDKEENAVYKNLLDICQYYLAYMTIVELAFKVSYKIGNAGVVKATDDNMQIATHTEIVSQKECYQGKADFYCLQVQNYILEHRNALPEVGENVSFRIQSNLYSAASCGMFLGGARGKRRKKA